MKFLCRCSWLFVPVLLLLFVMSIIWNKTLILKKQLSYYSFNSVHLLFSSMQAYDFCSDYPSIIFVTWLKLSIYVGSFKYLTPLVLWGFAVSKIGTGQVICLRSWKLPPDYNCTRESNNQNSHTTIYYNIFDASR